MHANSHLAAKSHLNNSAITSRTTRTFAHSIPAMSWMLLATMLWARSMQLVAARSETSATQFVQISADGACCHWAAGAASKALWRNTSRARDSNSCKQMCDADRECTHCSHSFQHICLLCSGCVMSSDNRYASWMRTNGTSPSSAAAEQRPLFSLSAHPPPLSFDCDLLVNQSLADRSMDNRTLNMTLRWQAYNSTAESNWTVHHSPVSVKASETAIVIIDMWNEHVRARVQPPDTSR